MITITNKAYYKAVASVDVAYTINPTDNFGNLLKRVFVDVDTTTADVTVTLPEIADLPANWDMEIILVVTAGANDLIVARAGADKIGSATSVTFTGAGKSITLGIVNSTVWSTSLTA
jgi:hypothetical protein